jgi:8-oxo-dGTP pyrophosphatase MutT (NUDIX family)
MATNASALQHFIAPLRSQLTEPVEWTLARFEVSTYLHDRVPPLDFITSVRAVVLRGHGEKAREVLVVQDPGGYHILPGGRREAGETLTETIVRELLEETGWQVTVGALLGFKHFYRLTPALPEFRYTDPHFAQLVYVAVATTYQPQAIEEDGYEIGAHFVAVDQLAQYKITVGEQLFLEAALTQ